MSIFSRLRPKRKPVEIKNTVPKEKANIRKTFGVYCHAHHGTSGEKLCPKCTAAVATVLTKMNRCRYGITKPICDRCEFAEQCFGAEQAKYFLDVMHGSQKRMFLHHPMLAFKHKLASWGVDYAKMQQQKKISDKIKTKEAAAKNRAKERKNKK